MLQQRTILFCSLLFSLLFVDAQSIPADYSKYSNLRSKIIAVVSDTISIDTMSIFPNTFIVRNLKTDELITNEDYDLNYATGKLMFKTAIKPDSILV